MKTLILTIVALIACLSTSSGQNWDGVFVESRFNSTLYLCQAGTGNLVQGFYGEVGFILGQLSPATNRRVLEGSWYQAGTKGPQKTGGMNPTYFPNFGNMTLALSMDDNTINGTFVYFNSTNLPIIWTATRQPGTPTDAQCWFSAASTASTLSSRWNDSSLVLDFCLDPPQEFTTYYASYDLYEDDHKYKDLLARGYTAGQCWFSGQLCSGDWWSKDSDGDYASGIFITRLLDDNTLAAASWTGTVGDVKWSNRGNGNVHQYVTLARLRSAVNCTRYEALNNGGKLRDSSKKSGGAHTVSGSWGIVTWAVAMALVALGKMLADLWA